MLRLVILSSLVALFTACATDAAAPSSADDAASVLDLSPGGAADTAGFPVIEVGGSGRFVVDVAPLPSGVSPSIENLGGVAHAFRMRLEAPASVAFIARGIDGDLDPHTIAKTAEGVSLAVGRDQAILPMAKERDAVVTFEAEGGQDYVFVVADMELAGTGRIAVDVVVLTDTLGLDLGWTDAAVRAVASELRSVDPDLSVHLQAGSIVEGLSGYVEVGDLTTVSLRDRAAVNGMIANVNDMRDTLYELYSEERPDAVGRAAAELYWAVRAP
jgi:hypothetical protein